MVAENPPNPGSEEDIIRLAHNGRHLVNVKANKLDLNSNSRLYDTARSDIGALNAVWGPASGELAALSPLGRCDA